MDKETNQENPSLLSNNNITKEDCSPKKHPGNTAVIGGGVGGGGGGNDRLKRDEWSEGAVSSLLEAYENKWVLRNRAKLKGHDWEDVARYVSARANCTKSPKTQTQCKNKIESMKKRYRSESATADGSSWPLYPRLDLLLRGSAPPPPPPQLHPLTVPQPPASLPTNPPLTLPEPSMVVMLQQQQPPPPPLASQVPGTAQNSHGSNGVDRILKEDGAGTKLSDHLSDKIAMETDSSTPALYSDKQKLGSKKLKMKMEKKKRRKKEEWEIGESIRWLAEVVLKSEQARMETMREIEKMRAEAEAKRGEMDLKRAEIIANTQLEIARLFAGSSKGVDSSLRIGRN
ncbi:trihelix transcription factor ASIL1-like [Durio zibethinus]|uniref:Trihelix transcription factor ASIL1-like n=1 Tax=Durio zibethinus TaxID=66656 RepID=A0A6P6AHN1_DURZI|nr:trihelix transcription factor ASIL1-like [Durio zibethinus]